MEYIKRNDEILEYRTHVYLFDNYYIIWWAGDVECYNMDGELIGKTSYQEDNKELLGKWVDGTFYLGKQAYIAYSDEAVYVFDLDAATEKFEVNRIMLPME